MTGGGSDGHALVSALADQPSLLDPQQLQIEERAEEEAASQTDAPVVSQQVLPAPEEMADEPVGSATPPDETAAEVAPQEPQE